MAFSRSKNLISIPPPFGRLISAILKRSSWLRSSDPASSQNRSRTASSILPKASFSYPLINFFWIVRSFSVCLASPSCGFQYTGKKKETFPVKGKFPKNIFYVLNRISSVQCFLRRHAIPGRHKYLLILTAGLNFVENQSFAIK